MKRPSSTSTLALALGLPLALALVWLAFPGERARAGRIEPGAAAAAVVEPLSAPAPEAIADPAPPSRRAQAVEVEPATRSLAPPTEPTAPVSGRLVDGGSGDGLAGWQLAVHARTGDPNGLDGWEWVETVSTDADGRFRTRAALPRCALRLEPRSSACPLPPGVDAGEHRLREDAVLPRSNQALFTHHDPARSRETRFELSIGPRYRVITALPPGLDACDFEAELALGGGAPVANGTLSAGQPFEASFESPVRAPAGIEGAWVLRLRSRDGSWAGAAPVDSVVGVCASPVAIELVARATLRGRVVDAQRHPVVDARLTWRPSPAPLAPERRGEARADRFGEFLLEGLRSGAGTLRVEARGAPALERELELRPHEEERVELQLEALRTGELTGHIECDGELAHPPRLELRAADVEGALTAKLEARAAGRVAFRFERVPVGDYELVAMPTDGARWEPERRRVRVPSSGHVLRRAAGESAMVVLDVLSAADGAPLSGVFGYLSSGEELLRSERNPPGALILDGVQEHLAGTLVVAAPGHEPRALLLTQLCRNGRFLAGEVRLAPGASSCVRVLAREGGRPLAGAVVGASSGPSAVTDRAGLAWLPVPRQSTSFTVVLDGWTTDGAEGTGDELLRVFLRPE